jgi:hypothetical protein
MGKDTQKNAGQAACILCVWEMGGNLGHLAGLKLFVDEALKRGHQVTLAVRELNHIDKVFDDYDIDLFQAPHLRLPVMAGQPRIISYTDMLIRQAFSSESQLDSLLRAWHSIFNAVSPDLVVYDHSPTALIASSEAPWKKWVVGSGFLVPRQIGPHLGVFPDLEKTPANDQKLDQVARDLLSMINNLLEQRGLSRWSSLSTLFSQTDRRLLLTIPELDHYGVRDDVCYLGVNSMSADLKPSWPLKPQANKSAKVFVYVNFFNGLDALLDELILQNSRVILFCKNLPQELQQKYRKAITLVNTPVDIKLLCQQGDYVVCNANHGTVVEAFAAGLPLLLIPLQQEQYLLSLRLKLLGRALLVAPDVVEYQAVLKRLWALSRKTVRLAVTLAEGAVEQRIAEVFDEEGF